jgi:tRNA(Ile)-lysidine synthase
MALSVLLHAYAGNHGHALFAYTVDHGLRAESCAEAQSVHHTLTNLGINHSILTWEHEGTPPQKRIQEMARTARYERLWQACQSQGIATLFTGHHQGDQIETFFMRLNHQSGLKGLCAMRADVHFCPTQSDGQKPSPQSEGQTPLTRPDGQKLSLQSTAQTPNTLRLIRPLLPIPKSRLTATLLARGISWVEDPSNQSKMYERIQMRKALEPLMQQGTLKPDAIMKSLQKLQAIDDYSDQSVMDFFKAHACAAFSTSAFPIKAFALEHPVLQTRLLLRVIRTLSDQTYSSPEEAIERLRLSIVSDTFKAATLGGLLFKRTHGGILRVSPEVRS